MRHSILRRSGLLAGLLLPVAMLASDNGQPKTLKEAFADHFIVGAAIPVAVPDGRMSEADSLTRLHFNSVVAENCMKHEKLRPAPGVYEWADADRFVEYGEQNGMVIIGHALVWHSQLAPWFDVSADGSKVSADTLAARLHEHIATVVGRYKGRIKGWDVVNEAILDDGSYRKSPFYEILGPDYIAMAFKWAHEADPDAELYLNDYAMASPAKRQTYIKIINDLKERGIRIDAIGMQGHMGLDYPNLTEFEKSIEAFGKTGIGVMITEWDMSALPTVNTGANIAETAEYAEALNPYPNGLPDSVSEFWNARMGEVLDIFLRHSDVITRVTAWGVDDSMSWKNDWPMAGRKEFPLLFDREFRHKPFLDKYLN